MIRYSNKARCFGTRCCVGPEAIAVCWTPGRGLKGKKKKLFLLLFSSYYRIKIKIWLVQYCFTIDWSEPRFMYCHAVLSGTEWLNLVIKGTFDLCCTARARKRGEEQSETRQEAEKN